MIKTILYLSFLFTFFIGCNAQEKVIANYIGYSFNSTKNSSYLSQELRFIKENGDTLKMNLRLPYDTISHNIINRGVFYNCHLKESVTYTFTLKKICASDIPEAFNSYYKTNIISDKKDCSKFTEIEKKTEYNYTGNYGKYVDINKTLYEILNISPDDGCIFQN